MEAFNKGEIISLSPWEATSRRDIVPLMSGKWQLIHLISLISPQTAQLYRRNTNNYHKPLQNSILFGWWQKEHLSYKVSWEFINKVFCNSHHNTAKKRGRMFFAKTDNHNSGTAETHYRNNTGFVWIFSSIWFVSKQSWSPGDESNHITESACRSSAGESM